MLRKLRNHDMTPEPGTNFLTWVESRDSTYRAMIGAERALGRENMTSVKEFLVYINDPGHERFGQIGQMTFDLKREKGGIEVEFVDGERVEFEQPERTEVGSWVGGLIRIPKVLLTDADKIALQTREPGIWKFLQGRWDVSPKGGEGQQ